MLVRPIDRGAPERCEADVCPGPSHERAVRDLLDHIANELAKEYLQLVQNSATKLPKPKV
jgi:hypothetical protein